MGYVFDALNRGDDNEPRPEEVGQSSDTPTPDEPVEDSGPGECDATAEVDQTPVTPPPIVGDEHAGWQPPAEEPDAPVFNFNEARASQPGTPPPTAEYDAPQAGPPIRETASTTLRLASQWSEKLDDRLVSLTEPSSQLAEEYRGIRTSLLARWEHRRNLVHTITSATPQEGKTITSLNLGLSLAELRNRKTIVIEADLRLPTFNKLLQLGESKGMIGYLRGNANLNEVIQELEGTALHIITAGSRASNDAVQLLSNNRMVKLLDTLRTKYDHVIIDTPPVIELADAGILGGLSDEVMLIARISRTPKPLIGQALRALRSYNAPVAGVIATDQERGRNRYHYYRYGYRYRYRYYAKRAA
jgi:protein-tyrosine kinase